MSAIRFHAGACYGAHAARREVGALVLAELQATVPEDEVHTHVHEDAHLVLVLQGEYVTSAVDAQLASRYVSETAASMRPAVNPTIVLNPPGTEHRDRFRTLGGRFITLSLPRAEWQDAAADARLPDHATRLDPTTAARAVMLAQELREWDDASALAVESTLADLLLAAAQQQQRTATDGPAWLDRVRQRLEDDPASPPTVKELAQLADVHPVYLARAFRRRYGCAPAEYLRQRRLDRAFEHLADRRMPLAEVAATSGYVDQAHLTRAVSNAIGVPPARYRRLLAD